MKMLAHLAHTLSSLTTGSPWHRAPQVRLALNAEHIIQHSPSLILQRRKVSAAERGAGSAKLTQPYVTETGPKSQSISLTSAY